MADHPEPDRRADGSSSGESAPFADSLASLLDRVTWDYDSDSEPSPLATTERFFRDFPWDEA